MALPEHELQELVVGLYDRGVDQPHERRIIDIGVSKILKSGIWSPYVVNFRPALSLDENSSVSMNQQRRTKRLLLEAASDEVDGLADELGFFHVYGPPENGTPLASAVAAIGGHSLLWRRIVSKADRGSHQELEGVYSIGQQAVEIDDVVTTALTKKEEAEFLAGYGVVAKAVVAFCDREQGGAQAVEAAGMRFRSPLGVSAMFRYLRDARRVSAVHTRYLLEYTENPPPLSEPEDFPW